jgi:molybdopterin-binding protein
MKISARNVLKGKITSLHEGAVNTEVVIDVKGVEVTSIITRQSVDTLKLRVGSEVYAVIKASDVMVAVDE